VLRVHLLGALEVELDGAVVDSPASQRPWSLFAYLALAGRPVPRGELAARFWPDVMDQSARASLRSALWALRRQLGDSVRVDGRQVALGDAWIDFHEFERLGRSEPLAALELCRGDLLEGVADEWALLARAGHRARVIELLERVAAAAVDRGDRTAALEFTRRQVSHDPLDEEANRRLISRLDAAGDRAGAVRAYRALVERLRRELGVAVSPETRALGEGLRAPATAAPAPARGLGTLPLIGRDREFGALWQTWESTARDGRGSVAILRGEAGIGKTRVARELVEQAGGLNAGCAALDLGGTAPLGLWAELLRELLPRVAPPPADAAWPADLAILSAELPDHFATSGAIPAIAPDLQRARLFEAVVALLGWATRQAPLLLVFEDIHRADAASLELLAYAARRAASLPLMVVLTRRDLPRHSDADRLESALRSRGLIGCELDLAPLDDASVATLARRAARLRDDQIRRVIARAEGNALLAVESARALAHGGEEVAASLRSSVRATLGSLTGPARELLELLAVALRPVELGGLPHEAALEALESGLATAGDGRIGFGHGLLREAVYAEMVEPQRVAMHRRWAQALLADEPGDALTRPAEVARHLRLAHADAEAVPHLARAAAAARSVGALEAAVGYLAEALTITPRAAELWLELGELEAWRGHRPESDEAFGQAMELLAGAPEIDLARASLRRVRANHGPICVPRLVLEVAKQTMELLEGCVDCEAERSEAVAACAWAEAVAGSVEEAERLLSMLDAGGRTDLAIYDVGHARALALMRRRRFRDAYGPSIAAGEAILRADRPDLAYGCWANAAGAAAAADEPERALEFLERGMDAVSGRGLRSLEMHLLAARAFVLRGLGRLEEARAAAHAERELADELGLADLRAMADHDLGLAALQEGAYTEAVERLEAALVAEAPISRPLTRLALAEALVGAGDMEGAATQLRETVLEPLRPSDFPAALVPRLSRVQGLIAAASGHPEEARARFGEAIDGWGRLAEDVDAKSMTTVLADLGRPVVGLIDPTRELERARADLERIPDAVVH